MIVGAGVVVSVSIVRVGAEEDLDIIGKHVCVAVASV
jgi:hypothetical protein